MKKFLLTAAVALASVASYAQSAAGSFSLIPKVGVNIANLTNADDAKVRVGVAAGVEAQYMFTDMVGVSAGVIYSQQGCKGDMGSSDADVTWKLDYINIPILANVYVAKGLAVKLGIQPAFNVSNKISAKDGGAEASVKTNDFVNTFDFSIPVGVSYEFSNIFVDARYNWGLTKWNDTSKMASALGYNAEAVSSKNSVFQITVGYKFEL